MIDKQEKAEKSAKAGKAAATPCAKALAEYRKQKLSQFVFSPVELVVHSVIGDRLENAADAAEAMGRLRHAFVDVNEYRVARIAEVARVLEPLPEAEQRARAMREVLEKLFVLAGSLDLSFLAELKATEGRKQLNDVDPNLSRTAAGHILFAYCLGVTIPLTPEGQKAATAKGLMKRGGNKQQLQKQMQTELSMPDAAELLQYFEADGAGVLTAKASARPTAKPHAKSAGKGTAKKAAKK